MSALLLVLVSFVGMELVSYATHRWVMHGFAMSWHRSHHLPPVSRFERNDFFPLTFSAVGVAAFALATMGPTIRPLLWVAIGVTLYGAAYLFVHEICIHRRAAVECGRGRYLTWLRTSHQLHHRFGGEPYGMLLPIVPQFLRSRPNADVEGLDRSMRASRRRRTRMARSRL